MTMIDSKAVLSDSAINAAAVALDEAVNGPGGGNDSSYAHWQKRARLAIEKAVEQALKDTLPTKAATRAGDPSTSRAAALSVGDLRNSQRVVLDLFKYDGAGMTDEELLDLYQRRIPYSIFMQSNRLSPSGLRSRRSELVRGGLLRNSGMKRKMSTGRMAVVWELAK